MVLQSSTQENGKELADRVLNASCLQDAQQPHCSKTVQQDLTGEQPPTLQWTESQMPHTTRTHQLDKLVESLVSAFWGKDPTFISTFLRCYRTFATSQQVLDRLFARYDCIFPYCEEDGGPLDRQKKAISFILDIWLKQYPEDFFQPPEFPCLMMLLAYLELNFPGSDLEHQAQLLLLDLRSLGPHEADTEEPAPERNREAPEEGTSTPVPPPEAPGTALAQGQDAVPPEVQEHHSSAPAGPAVPGPELPPAPAAQAESASPAL